MVSNEGELKGITVEEAKNWSQVATKTAAAAKGSFADAFAQEPEEKEAESDKGGRRVIARARSPATGIDECEIVRPDHLKK